MYKIINKIGNGSYGEVFVGKHLRKNEFVAIKTESLYKINNASFSMLKNEAKIYKYIPNGPGISRLKWFGQSNGFMCMVISLLGQNIDDYKKKYFSTGMSQEMVYNIGRRLMDVIQHVHLSFLIHGDIKPDNILFMANNFEINALHIIDFGLSRTYMTNMHTHELPGKTFKLIGTPIYASIGAHNCQKLSRRDDMESIGYVLLHISTNSLPWSTSETHENILEQKIKFRDAIKSIHLNDQSPLVIYFNMVFTLNHDSEPKYKVFV